MGNEGVPIVPYAVIIPHLQTMLPNPWTLVGRYSRGEECEPLASCSGLKKYCQGDLAGVVRRVWMMAGLAEPGLIGEVGVEADLVEDGGGGCLFGEPSRGSKAVAT